MIITPKNTDLKRLNQKLDELKGKPIFQAYHTFGSMFLFDMGSKTESLSLGRINLNGENTVIVENYTWQLKKSDLELITSKDTPSEMRRKIPSLVGTNIKEIMLTNHFLQFIFDNNLELNVNYSNKTDRDLAIRLQNSNWIEISPGHSWQEVTADHID